MTFDKESEKALQKYLRTAIVIDDDVYLDDNDKQITTQTRYPSRINPEYSDHEYELQTENSSQSTRIALDVQGIVQAFFEKGILCTVLKSKDIPDDKTPLKNADILILDWMLGDDGQKSSAYIRNLAINHADALHMICIYTSEQDKTKIKNSINDYRYNNDEENKIKFKTHSKNKKIIHYKGIHVLIINKGTTTPNNNLIRSRYRNRGVSPEQLPTLLLAQFYPCVCGLLRNTVFYAINALRNNTHVLLERFSPELDPAFLTHRVLSNPITDTEQHIIPIICSEIESILTQNNISNNLNARSIEKWIRSRYNILQSNNKDQATTSRLLNNIDKIIRHGIFIKIGTENLISKSKIKELLQTSYLTYFWGSSNPVLADAKLSNMMCCEHLYSKCIPILKTGTLLKITRKRSLKKFLPRNCPKTKYCLCIQAPCDCVRIEENEGRPFIFIPLFESQLGDKFNFIITKNNKKLIYLYDHRKYYNLFSISFKPNENETCICAQEEFQKYFLYDCDGNRFEFILQLKEIHALHHVQGYSTELSRIGLTESDWQRRCARGEHIVQK